MKIIITANTEKKIPSKQELDQTVNLVLQAGKIISKKLKYKECRCRCRANSTSLILTK